MSTRLSSTKPRGQLFPSRCPPGCPWQSQEVSSFPADAHQGVLNKAKRSALSQQMSTRISLTKPRGQLFPSRCPPGYPQQSQEVSSFPADVHQAILNKAKRSALSQQMSTRLSLTKSTNSQILTGRGRTVTIRINHNRSTALERSVMNYCGLCQGNHDRIVISNPLVSNNLWYCTGYDTHNCSKSFRLTR